MNCPFCGAENPERARFCMECGAGLAAATETASTSPSLDATPNGFVGRQREMADLGSALEEALAGRGRLVTLVGEPGIGKTRTAQELTNHAQSLGAQVLWGWCYEGEGAPPYWPWVHALRSYVQRTESKQLLQEMGAGAADIAEILPEVRTKLPVLEPSPALEPEQARFRLFDSITTFVKKAAQTRPMTLVLDDLHWADRSSLLLLEFVAQGIESTPLLVLGTYRDVELSRQHPLSETLARLSRGPVFQRVPLRGLDREGTTNFIAASAGMQPTTPLVETVYSHTEGNPFFIAEVIQLLSDTGELASGLSGSPEGLRIPEGVREVIGQRLNRMSEQCNEVLTTASIIGREFDFRLLNLLGEGLSEAKLLRAVDEGVSFHLIEEVPDAMDRYRFSHALIQQTLAEELTTSRRVRLHARIGEALEELYGHSAESHAAELAHHFAEAQTVTGPDKLVFYSLQTGEQALASYAWEEAQAHFERALLAKGLPLDSQAPAKDPEAARLLFGLARAQLAMLQRHEMAQAANPLSRAFNYYAEEGDVDRAVEVAEYPYAPSSGYSLGITKLIARALELVPAESHQAGRLLSRYCLLLALEEGDYVGAQQAVARALSIAEREHDSVLEMGTLANGARIDRAFGDYPEASRKSLRAIELARRLNDPLSEVAAHYEAQLVLRYAGELEHARPHAVAMLEGAERLRDSFWLSSALNAHAFLSYAVGDWQLAWNFSDRSLAASPGDYRALAFRTVSEYQVGAFDQGGVHLERLLEIMRLSAAGSGFATALPALVIPVIARITGLTNRLEVAEAAARTVLSSSATSVNVTQVAASGLGLVAVARNDTTAAREQYEGLQQVRGTGTILQGGANTTFDRILGLLAQTMGDLDQAEVHFEDSLKFCRKAGFRPELAWTCCDYADSLLERNIPGDREKAMSLLNESLHISTELGMRPLMERVQARIERMGSSSSTAPAYPDGLTQREVEVLNLIAQGKTNRGIGEALVISEGTVRRHVNNIYDKIGVANRAEATRYALEKELKPSH